MLHVDDSIFLALSALSKYMRLALQLFSSPNGTLVKFLPRGAELKILGPSDLLQARGSKQWIQSLFHIALRHPIQR
jgi:hypothetical protein